MCANVSQLSGILSTSQISGRLNTRSRVSARSLGDMGNLPHDLDHTPTTSISMMAPPVRLPFRDVVLVTIGLSASMFLASLDQTIVATATPAIASNFQRFDLIAWIGTSYLLTNTAFQPLYGKFSDIFGRKFTMLFAVAIFLLGSLLCGIATSMPMLIACRAIAGLGGAGIVSLTLIIVSEIVSIQSRAKYHSIIIGVYTFSSVLGPLLGGVFTDKVSWRWAFYINLPIGAVTIAILWFFLPFPRPDGSLREKLQQIDYFGVLLVVVGVVLILLPINWGGKDYPWQSPTIITLFVAGAVALALFVYVEARVAKVPIMPTHLFFQRNIVLSYLLCFFIGIGFFGLAFFMSIWFQMVNKTSATQSGLRVLPLIGALTLASFANGWIVSATGWLRPSIIAGCVISTVGVGLLITLTASTPYGHFVAILILCGLGLGMSIQPITLIAQLSATEADMAVATAYCTFFRSIGGVIGVALCGAMLNSRVSIEMRRRVPDISEDLIQTLQTSIYTVRGLEPTLQQHAVESYAAAFHYGFIICTVLLGFSVICSLGYERADMEDRSKTVSMSEA